MTDWSQLVSDEELVKAANVRKVSVDKKTKVKPEDVPALEAAGWKVVKTDAKGKATMEKDKPFFDVFENEVWMIFYKMGFKYMNATNDFKFDFDGNTKQVDVVAIDDETCICVECKATQQFEKSHSFKLDLEAIHGYYQDLQTAVKKQYGNHLKFRYIFATKNYLITDDSADMGRMKSFNITYFDYDTVQYYGALVEHLGTAGRYQFLGNIFQNTKIAGLENRVPAIKGKMGGLTYYAFLIEPEKLLKMAYVLHRNKANHLLMPTYQRLIKKDRLKAIRNFVNNGGYFPNSLIVSIDTSGDNLRFDQNSQNFESVSKTGTLYLPQKYHSIYVIDGQHRLYGYSESDYADTNVIPVVAFENLASEKQVEMFMEINENQKSVSKSLRNTLNIDLLWNSSDAKKRKEALMLRTAEALGEDPHSPWYGRILTGEDSKTNMRCITTEYVKDAIKNSAFLNEYEKNIVKKQGTLDRNDNDQTSGLLLTYIKKFLSTIAEYCSDEWDKGSEGFLTINNSSYALIKVFDDITNIVLKEQGINVINDVDSFYDLCEPMVLELCEVITEFKEEDKDKIKNAKGGGAKKETWRVYQVALNSKNPSYINEELEEYIDQYCTDNNFESNEYIEAIEQYLKVKFRETLEQDADWLHNLVPDSLGKTITLNVANANYKRHGLGQPDVDAWEFISFDEIFKIAQHGNNWTTFAQAILSRPSQKNSKSTTGTWLKNLKNYSSKIKGEKSLTRNEFEDLQLIYKDFCGEEDVTSD